MRKVAVLFAVGVLVSMTIGAASTADARPLKFSPATALKVCQRACTPPVNKIRCCICSGGVWTGKFCV